VADLRAFFAEAGVARAKTPECVAAVDALPRNASGKVTKHLLRATITFPAVSSPPPSSSI
jgi:non-ribosomal peptide synthetase component E (peptide arylation enzyme)